MPAPARAPASASTKAPFPALFWITNLIEVLERTAYYGAIAVTALRMDAQGISDAQAGIVAGILLPLPFVTPLVSSSLAEKFGYRPMLLLAYVLYAAGFVTFAFAGTFWMFVVAVVLLGLGSGTFKPIPAATIGIVSPMERTKQGYSLYYAAINIGGFLGPLVAGLLVLALGGSGAEDATAAQQAALGRAHQAMLVLCAVVMALLAVVTALLFRNPKPAQPTLTVAQGFARFVPGLRDGRFMALLVIFSGFWFLYAMNFSFLFDYVQDYVDLPGWFSPEMQNAVNPFVIVLFGIPLGLLADRMKGFRSLTLGIALFAAGFILIGFVPTFWALVAGLVIATVGEILAYPGFLAHVAKVAGPERASAYQSLGFLPVGLGFFIGPIVGGALFGSLVTDQGRPELFWALMVSIALVTLAAMVVYDHFSRPAEDRRAHLTIPATVVALGLAPALVLFGAILSQEDAPPGVEPGSEAFVQAFAGETAEGEATLVAFTVPANATGEVRFELAWEDEPDQDPAVNRPDALVLRILDAAGNELPYVGEGDSVAGSGGTAFALATAEPGATWTVEVRVTEAGDQVLGVPLAGDAVVAPDEGNSWRVEVTGQASVPANARAAPA